MDGPIMVNLLPEQFKLLSTQVARLIGGLGLMLVSEVPEGIAFGLELSTAENARKGHWVASRFYNHFIWI